MFQFYNHPNSFAVVFPLARGNTFPKFLTVMQLPSTPIDLTDQGGYGVKSPKGTPI